MLLSRNLRRNVLLSLALVGFAASCARPGTAAEVCPIRTAAPLRLVEVYDGAPEDLADLMADRPGPTSGYYTLGQIYDQGGFVTVRCKYADGFATDVKLSARVAGCEYRFDAKKNLSLTCR